MKVAHVRRLQSWNFDILTSCLWSHYLLCLGTFTTFTEGTWLCEGNGNEHKCTNIVWWLQRLQRTIQHIFFVLKKSMSSYLYVSLMQIFILYEETTGQYGSTILNSTCHKGCKNDVSNFSPTHDHNMLQIAKMQAIINAIVEAIEK